MSSALDITWTHGQTEEWTLTVFNADSSPSDLSTAIAIEFEVKKFRGEADPADLHLDLAGGVTRHAQVGADIGVCDVVATSAQTYTLLPGIWNYDVFVTRADGARKQVMAGKLTMTEVVNFP